MLLRSMTERFNGLWPLSSSDQREWKDARGAGIPKGMIDGRYSCHYEYGIDDYSIK